jgi:hypothetical protein
MTATRPPRVEPRGDDDDAGWGPRGRGGHRPSRRAISRVRRVAVGDERRIGLWLLPLFLLTAALAATLSGGLAVLYYAQQVSSLRAETAEARAQLDEAVTTVETAVEEATTAIDEQVARVRAQLAQGVPVPSPNDAGVYAVAARHPDGAVRVASAFTVFSDENETFLVTSYSAVSQAGGGAVERVEVFVPGQVVAGRVHAFDRSLDLAALVLSGGPLPVTEWRPAGEPLAIGDVLYLYGIGGPDTPAIVESRVAAASAEAVVPTTPVNAFTAGGPFLDVEGRIVAVGALQYRPFGPSAGALPYAVPIRALCDGLLRCTASDVGAGGLGEGGSQAGDRPTAPGARAQPARPSPSPQPGAGSDGQSGAATGAQPGGGAQPGDATPGGQSGSGAAPSPGGTSPPPADAPGGTQGGQAP